MTITANRLTRFAEKLPGQSRPIFLTCLFGLGAGLAAVAFQLSMNGLYRLGVVRLSQASPITFVVGSLLVIVSTSLVVGYLLSSFSPEASGSGVPQLKLAFWKDFGFVPWRVVWVKYLAGVLSIGGGCSLGREGPSVQLAGGLASNLAGLFGEAKQHRRLAAAAGAAAGLAAAFNTPLAAVTFVLEEIIAVQRLLRTHPYQRFPLVLIGGVSGILTRKELELSLVQKRPPKWEAVVTCLPHQTIRDLQGLLIESTSQMVVLLDQPRGKLIGLVTLHDLLRAQVSMARNGAS